MRAVTLTLVFLLGAGLASPASADNDKGKGKGQNQGQGQSQDHGQGQGQGHGKGDNNNDNDNDQGRGRTVVVPNQQVLPYQQVVIIDRDRDTLHTYYRNEYAAGRCPPGLAKKNNGCMPPGQVDRVWVVGQPLPPEIVYYPMPPDLYSQLTPPPYGYQYVRVDNNVMLINATSRLIAQILSNVGG